MTSHAYCLLFHKNLAQREIYKPSFHSSVWRPRSLAWIAEKASPKRIRACGACDTGSNPVGGVYFFLLVKYPISDYIL